MKTISIMIIVLLSPSVSFACKEALLAETYPISDFSYYSHVVVASINKSSHSVNYRYKPLLSFEATVIESLKGNLQPGSKFNGKPKQEPPKAVCPVHLTEGGTYILLLSNENGEYTVSRFSFPIESDNKYFSSYIEQIKGAIASE